MDNSGARTVQCIKTLGGSFRVVSHCGEYILVSVKTLRFIRKVQTHGIYLGLIARTKKNIKFKDGTISNFNKNSLILVNRQRKVLGTRILGPVSRRLRKKKFMRILLMCGRKIY